MQKTFNKVIALLLSCFLASSLLPATALAMTAQTDNRQYEQEDAYVVESAFELDVSESGDEVVAADEGQTVDFMALPSSDQEDMIVDAETEDDAESTEESRENPKIEELIAKGDIVEDEVIVVYKDDPIDLVETAKKSMPDVEVIAQEELTESEDSHAIDLVELSEDTTITAAIEDIAKNPAVDFVQPNYIYSAASISPDDPYFRDNKQYYLTSCGFDDAWESAKCEGATTVAVIDSGCNYTHIDLSDPNQTGGVLTSLARDVTTTNPSTLLAYNDATGHGTAVAGVVGAKTNNAIGVAGATYNANVLPIKVFDANRECKTSYLVKGFQYLFSLKESGSVSNLHVLNMSLGGYQEDPALHAQVAKAKDAHQILSVCAGGNGNEKDTPYKAKSYPSDYDECLSVTSLTKNDMDSAWSDYNAYKDISAPGEGIWTTSAAHGYVAMSGTSLAAPVVASAAALLWKYDSTLSVDDVMDLLKSTASRISGSIRPGNGSAGKLNIEAAMNKLIAQKTGSGSSGSGNKITKPSSSIMHIFNGGMQRAVSASSTYTISGVNTATNVGSYTAYVTPNDGYVWSDTNNRSPLAINWKITPADLSSASIAGIYSRYTFTGGAVLPYPVVTLNGNVLAKGEHYEVTYTNNVYPGTATMTIRGIGSCSGTRIISYGIGTNAEQFANRLYSIVLGRNPDITGLRAQVNALNHGTPAAQVAWGFFGSVEFANRNLTNEQRVEIAYKAMLDRGSDASGRVGWTNKLDVGMSIRAIVAGFSESNEFRSLCARWGIQPGTLSIAENRDRNYNVTAFVDRLYRIVLNRSGDVGGINAQTGALLGGTPAAQVAWGFFGSVEFANRNLTNEQRVEIAYKTMLNRIPAASEKEAWANRLNAGMSLYLLIAGFVGSNEFQQLCRSYGITAGSLPYNPADVLKYPTTPNSNAQAGSAAQALSATIEHDQPIKCNEVTTFTFNATGGNGGYMYMPYSLMVKNGNSWEEAANLTYQSYTTKNTFDFVFTMSGDYRLTVAVIDPPDYSLRRFVTEFIISADQGITPAQRNARAEAKADEVWAACQAAGCTTEYEKALWLHDWIIGNCTYDYDLMYCKDVDLFVDGIGTCEAYHSAYMKLLNKAGIACGRAYDAGHVWTLVRVDGKWYHVDTTHDDTAGHDWFGLGDDEAHLYFGLDDELMRDVLAVNGGAIKGRTPDVAATSLDSNYFIKSGLIKHYSDYFLQDIQTNLDAGKTSFDLSVPSCLAAEKSDLPPTYKMIIYSLVAHDLQASSWISSGKAVALEARYENGKIAFSATYA